MQDLIIVLSYFRDLTARYVVEALTRRQIPALLLDAGDFPLHVRLDASFTESEQEAPSLQSGEECESFSGGLDGGFSPHILSSTFVY